MARQFSTGTKFGSKKGKVQNPARIPPQTPPAGGKKAEAEKEQAIIDANKRLIEIMEKKIEGVLSEI